MTALPFPEKIHLRSQPAIADASDVIELGDNYVQALETGLNPQHEVWDVVYSALNRADLNTLLGVLDTVRTVTPVTWTSPLYQVQKKYMIVKDSRRPMPLGADLWEFGLKLREVP
ncbi:hypothetical protein PL263_10320 [Methylomonas sp. EFPC3]|uniref:hypothetical protein n=1 Tax=Methylomonas sp. EFPC3 TaxID=3021710 RepID=UPI00241679FA|nr:hypothetical protein [Methylomonas sp. EFPC3]WFP48507.1 hypothetical protein PL263_10320 [Methylomonas sp. EFPC3]